jgi:diphosphomevalonate decarboxylase
MIFAEAPSNIALIKYMGKVAGLERNKPTNASFSLTLDHLKSRVEIYESNDAYDRWETLKEGEWIPTSLSERGRKRYLAHFEFLKQKLGIFGKFVVKSANNFPSDCGIASSASSFAALTLATYELAKKQNPKIDLTIQKVSELSRVGSGSSIRSFFGPFCIWDNESAREVDLPLKNFLHQVVVVEKAKKAIGSSDAHELVPTSLLFQGRTTRASVRMQELILAWKSLPENSKSNEKNVGPSDSNKSATEHTESKSWKTIYELCWAEFWDMHALFSTAQPPFQYMLPASLEILNAVSQIWSETGDGPVVTMDAGANVHLIWRSNQNDMMRTFYEIWVHKYNIIDSTRKVSIGSEQ